MRRTRLRGYEVSEGSADPDLEISFSTVETVDQARERKFGEARTRVTLQQLNEDLEPVIRASEAYVTIVWSKAVRELLDATLSARDRHAILSDLSRKLVRELHDTAETLVQLRSEHEAVRLKTLKRTM